MLVGYARAGLNAATIEAQEHALRQAGCDRLILDIAPLYYRQKSRQLAEALSTMTNGDTLVITRLSCLADTIADLTPLMSQLSSSGVQLLCLEQLKGTVGSVSLASIARLLEALKDLESEGRHNARRRGIWEAKKAKVYKGRPPVIDRGMVQALRSEGKGVSQIAAQLGIARQSVHRILKELKNKAVNP